MNTDNDDSKQIGTILILSSDPAHHSQLMGILGDTDLKLQHADINGLFEHDITLHTPDLTLLDYSKSQNPQSPTHYQLLKLSEHHFNVPALAICVATETNRITEAFQAGFQDVITTPFRKEEVYARITTHLKFCIQRQELLEQQERFQKLAEATSEGILIHDQGIILEVNQAILNMSGYEYSELIGKDAITLLTPESRASAQTHFETNTERSCKLFANRRDGSQIPIIIQERRINWKGRNIRVVAVRDISMQSFIHQEQQTLSAAIGENDHFGSLVGRSRIMKKVYETILRSAVTDSPVIIYGETGTGKELTARMIFEKSDHHRKCFLPVNCASIPDHLFESQFFGHRKGSFTGADYNYQGYFEQAQGGTLFLDEVGELPLPMQAKLLRIIEDHTYTPVGSRTPAHADVRLIAATNKNLHDLERQGKFRSDFFYRLHVLSIDLPPLRARKEDVPLLVIHYLKRQTESGRKHAIDDLPASLLEQLNEYNWPGNVRELFNVLERYLITKEVRLDTHTNNGHPIHESLDFLGAGTPLTAAMERFEQYYIHKVLTHHHGQKNKTAEALQVNRKTLYKKLIKYSSQPK